MNKYKVYFRGFEVGYVEGFDIYDAFEKANLMKQTGLDYWKMPENYCGNIGEKVDFRTLSQSLNF